MPEAAPDTTTGNPFSLIAYVLFKARHGLEEIEADRPPRWVRIARGRDYASDQLGGFVRTAVGGLANATSYMAELTLDIEELLLQTDAAKAIADTSLDLVKAATDPNFVAGITALLGNDINDNLATAFAGINGAANNIQGVLGFIPEPHDVRQLGHELYRLQCIVQRPLPRNPETGAIDTAATELVGEEHLELGLCGKIRLCAWAYDLPVRTRGLGPTENVHRDLTRLGARRLFLPGASGLATRARSRFTFDGQPIDVFDFPFATPNDLAELVSLLQAHGYQEPPMPVAPTTMTAEIVSNLLQFQYLNELPLTGELDNHTLNRLHNLDFGRKNLRRAVRHRATAWPWVTGTNTTPLALGGELLVVNGGADRPEDEHVDVQATTPHPYYVVPATPAWNPLTERGWLSDTSGLPGFVALASRSRNADEQNGRYIGGRWSEGEAAFGRFFWAARHVEPWKAGRSGLPESGALFGSHGNPAPQSGISRMYQWIPLPSWLDPATPPLPGARLYVRASALQRSLWSDRDESGFSDQGRLLLEAHPQGPSAFTSPASPHPDDVTRMVASDWFPSHGMTALALSLSEIDRRRLWVLRHTPELEIAAADAIQALCLVVEGQHRHAYDTDAYFDDIRVHYEWRMPGSGA
jgi:hypothetical protein